MSRSIGIQLDPARPAPLYQQIFDQVVDRIRTGALPPGSRLPPTRALASELSTHRNTVVRAFEELAAAGFLEAVVGRGTFVSARDQYGYAPAPSGAELPWDTLVSRAARAEPLERLDRLGQQLTAGPVINLQKMQPDAALLPHDLLRRCVDHVLRTQGPRALGYSPPEGLPRLRQQIAAALARSGVPVRADDLIITSGSQQALDLLVRALVDPGDVFLVERATYAGMISALAAAGARVVCAPGDAEGPDPAAPREVVI